uniref:Uncharacterized protein n=1 Tax=Tanacetum cinerariifolium TaxID=118510 RepID=A0A6L2MQ50_TANCI|nr:hypothetical protein [Tanacetum cinerariifolium]
MAQLLFKINMIYLKEVLSSYEKMYPLMEMRSVEETQKCNRFGGHFISGTALRSGDQLIAIRYKLQLFI